jgi:hypothetical protein
MGDGAVGYQPDVRMLHRELGLLEGRVHDLQARLSRDGLTDEGVLESAAIVTDLQRLYRMLQEERGRRDLRFRTERRLGRLEEWSRWLVRKVVDEFLFGARLSLERRLTAELPAPSRDLYRLMGELNDIAHEIAELPEGALAEKLWAGELAPLLIENLQLLSARFGPAPHPALADLADIPAEEVREGL